MLLNELLPKKKSPLMITDIGESAKGLMMSTKTEYFAYSKSKVGKRLVSVVRTETLFEKIQRKA
ncbi:hypothetical protein ACRZ5S_22870 (plasmid) [Vibrio scophthalmi]|uniref:hypothetical protein n=1 Tax=Vibrio scophthalmi TaxID=45658 RepID=UPI003EBA01AF